METGNKTEETPGCLREGDDGEVSYSGACVEEPPPDPLGGDDCTGPWQRTGAVGEGGPAHPDDTCRGALQPRWRTGSPRLLDCCNEEAGREEQSSPTFDLQLCVSSVVQASNVRTFSTFALMTTGAFSQNIRLFSKLLVTDNLSLYLCSSPLRSH